MRLPPQQTEGTAYVEPLTDRERDVLRLGHPPRRREQERPGHLGGGVGEHAGGVGDHHAAFGGAGDVDVVEAHGVVGEALGAFRGVKHDGVLPLCGMYLGKPIRHNYNHNHAVAIRQLFGLMGWETDPKTLYRNQANRIKNAGL
mgnify:CR=1 FL=1